jgi:hypothetical protein
MGNINLGRMILGGLVAGIIIDAGEGVLNTLILGERLAQVMAALGKPATGAGQIVVFNLWGLVAGILMIWLYAAIRPRYGPGPKTALRAGLAVWVLAFELGYATLLILGLFPMDAIVTMSIAGLIETILGSLAGAAIYKEESASAAQPSPVRA